MKQRLISALLVAAVLAAVAVAGCSAGGKNSSETASSQTTTETQTDAASTTADAPEATLAGLTATKVGSVKIDAAEIDIDEHGIIYTDANGKNGVLGFDGKNLTAAQYAKAARTVKQYLRVFTAAPAKDNYNTCGLVGVDGTEAIGTEYGYIEPLNERYALVFTIDGETADTEKIVLSKKAGDDEFTYTPGKDAGTSFAGTWGVFDLQSKALVNGLSGTKYDHKDIKASGQFLTVKTADDQTHIYDAKGAEITDGRRIFSDGSYLLEVNENGAVYSADGERLFAYNASDYSITAMAELPDYTPGDGYIAKQGENWVVLNKQGEVISAPFPKQISNAYPGYVELWDSDMKWDLYTLDGQKAVEGGRITRFDAVNRDAYLFDTGEGYYVLDGSGNTVLTKATGNTGLLGNFIDEFLFAQDGSYYNFAEGAYSIEGRTTYTNWLVVRERGKLNDLIDTRSGKAILEGYLDYKSVVVGNVQYVYAFNSVNGQYNKGDFDVYTVAK